MPFQARHGSMEHVQEPGKFLFFISTYFVKFHFEKALSILNNQCLEGRRVLASKTSVVWRRRIERACWTIQTHSDELNWARRQTFHELNSLSLVHLIKFHQP